MSVRISNAVREREKGVRVYIEEHSRTFSLDPNLIRALITQESRFIAEATSPTGAYGYGQFTGIGSRQVKNIAAMPDCPDPTDLESFTKNMASNPDVGIKAVCATLWWLFNKKYRQVEDKKVQLEAVLTFYNAGGKPAHLVVKHGGHAQAIPHIRALDPKYHSQSLKYAPEVAQWYVAWHELLRPETVVKEEPERISVADDNPFDGKRKLDAGYQVLVTSLELLGKKDSNVDVMLDVREGLTEVTLVFPGEFLQDVGS
jgi:hypothetical protein